MMKMRMMITAAMLLTGCASVQRGYEHAVDDAIQRQPLGTGRILTMEATERLPLPVRRYLVYTGAVGRAVPQNMVVEFDAQMVQKRGEAPMTARSEQWNWFGEYTRIFTMSARKAMVPFQALHRYEKGAATFVVRVASLFNVVDLAGDTLTQAETVTLLNDLCVFAPGTLTDPRLVWQPVDDTTAGVTFTNGAYTVRATLHFRPDGELIDFVSDDRYALENDGSLRNVRWSTPLSDYREFDGRRVPTYGEAIYHYPEGPFVYGTFRLRSIRFDVSGR